MTPNAILFGGLGSLTETFDIERDAFNLAFSKAGLDWHWSADDFQAICNTPDDRARIMGYADLHPADIDPAELTIAKAKHFEDLVLEKEILPRPGVRELIDWAQSEGIKLGLASTAEPEHISLLLGGLAPEVLRSDFAFIGDGEDLAAPKPAPDIFERTLEALAVPAREAIALEASPEGAQAARAAGIKTIGFPGAVWENHTFPEDVAVVRQLTRALFVLNET